ncbi:MAG: enhanced serine sensitivity protein SseB C-terminal domain-containing protein [Metallibacterium scheffleri]|jgi:hypothetical protein|uniref:enhanced serine sensitivity protein SseB C-terminal domain-containing protein n=1 Tax=Metallibacterium scheffleri TaxID=993689 RepID=UPI0026EBDAFA|nr:enhanced serine sensitivity protein SseB C-terminal domain-containing protein [Metallibacterium scheffleri]MCK9366592.1 enhanced serine sensitivity protein SseB C-terminal domain-containing protein [Metallibacterium scheffleri]
MASAKLLQELLQATRQSAGSSNEVTRAQDAFFKALLKSTVYAHVPLAPSPPGRMRFVQFVRPDNGQTVLPFFSDREQAEVAAGGVYAILAMAGRELLELTRGATLMFNPNVDRIVLYPPEVNAVLTGQSIGVFSREVKTESEQVGACLPSCSPDALTPVLQKRFATEPSVRAAYLVELHRGPELADISLLLGIVVAAAHHERLLQLTTLWIQPALQDLTMPLSILLCEPDEELPEVFHHGIQFYGV